MKDRTEIEAPGRYGDGDIPEIDLPKSDNASNTIPDELPGRQKNAGRPDPLKPAVG